MPHDIRIVTEPDLRNAIGLDLDVIDCIEHGFRQLDGGSVIMPPVLSMAMPDAHAEVDIKTAYVPGLEGFAIKVSPGFFNNPSLGLPSLNGLMVLLSAKTGQVLAIFLDNGYLTDMRTAAAGAVAARHMAPEKVETVGVIGTGLQARLQVIAASKVRSFKKICIWGRDIEKAERLARDLETELSIEPFVMPAPDDVVAQSQLVVTTTPATAPVLGSAALHSGLHITAMGSDQDGKNEIDPAVLAKADRIVCDRISQCEKMGELRSALAAGGVAGLEDPRLTELGAVISGRAAGRSSADQITVCDLTGTGIQDTAIATLAHARVRAGGAGTRIQS
ncbi:cyclodeaminase [Roseibium aquae]|uniref:Cyclodeaminase n=1 Tax=Roseibium aquae TaxID=1323746 RepID=A0A916TIS4_9HYPH|nr:cyclodeaminase [Roseibium aquae]GGB46321.1 cyclodeaminase [Roseibium aquae]